MSKKMCYAKTMVLSILGFLAAAGAVVAIGWLASHAVSLYFVHVIRPLFHTERYSDAELFIGLAHIAALFGVILGVELISSGVCRKKQTKPAKKSKSKNKAK